jgi:hypothetical protein
VSEVTVTNLVAFLQPEKIINILSISLWEEVKTIF